MSEQIRQLVEILRLIRNGFFRVLIFLVCCLVVIDAYHVFTPDQVIAGGKLCSVVFLYAALAGLVHAICLICAPALFRDNQ